MCVAHVHVPLCAGGLLVCAGECAPFSASSRDVAHAATRDDPNGGLHVSCADASEMAVLGP